MNVSFVKSTVHVPFNVYAKKDDVLLGANYTSNLDQFFAKNNKGDNENMIAQTESWQYFASRVGYTRFFPGLQWKLMDDIGRPIDYDARFEPWYISSINYPKELIIVLDSSGSMKG